MTTVSSNVLAGLKVILPILPGLAPFGLVAGIAGVEAGLTPLESIAVSVIIFAGAAHLAALQLLVSGALPIVVIGTALVINLRFAMYSASIAPYFRHLSARWRFLLAFLLTDQAYAVSISRFMAETGQGDDDRHWYYFAAGMLTSGTWVISVSIGAFLGATIPEAWSLDFAIPLIFMAMVMPVLRDRPNVIAALVGGSVAVIAADLPLHLGMVAAAVLGISAGTLADRRRGRSARKGEDSR